MHIHIEDAFWLLLPLRLSSSFLWLFRYFKKCIQGLYFEFQDDLMKFSLKFNLRSTRSGCKIFFPFSAEREVSSIEKPSQIAVLIGPLDTVMHFCSSNLYLFWIQKQISTSSGGQENIISCNNPAHLKKSS